MSEVINVDEIIGKLTVLNEWNDPEKSHSLADGILCDLLKELGFGDVVDAYEAVDKY